MPLQNYHKTISKSSPELDAYLNRSLDILERIQELIDEKFDGKQKLLAEKMCKTEAEVSKMIRSAQNFTMRTIVKLEIAFGEPILHVHTNEDARDYVPVKCAPGSYYPLAISNGGKLQKKLEYQRIQVAESDSAYQSNAIT